MLRQQSPRPIEQTGSSATVLSMEKDSRQQSPRPIRQRRCSPVIVSPLVGETTERGSTTERRPGAWDLGLGVEPKEGLGLGTWGLGYNPKKAWGLGLGYNPTRGGRGRAADTARGMADERKATGLQGICHAPRVAGPYSAPRPPRGLSPRRGSLENALRHRYPWATGPPLRLCGLGGRTPLPCPPARPRP